MLLHLVRYSCDAFKSYEESVDMKSPLSVIMWSLALDDDSYSTLVPLPMYKRSSRQ